MANETPAAENFSTVMGAAGSNAKYEKVRVLGRGSFGQAWLVKRQSDGKLLVAKEMDLSRMQQKDQRYVEAEKQCLAACHHFAIVRYEEDFVEGKTMLIIMEFADAGDLSMQIKSRAADGGNLFQEHEVGYTFVQMCMALDHIHRGKMLHRDIKSANVLLMSSGLIKLGDFGFSQQYNDSVSGDVAGTFCGTPYYLAPELWRRDRYSKKADVWALGVLLYEMMALRRPFTGQGMRPLMEAVLKGTVHPLPTSFSQPLRDLCLGLLVADPNLRPSIAQIFQLPYVRRLLDDFERSAGASTLIDADTKTVLLDNVKEAKSASEGDMNSADHCGQVGQVNKSIEHEGPIRKESGSVWKERFFMLRDGCLVISVRKGDTETKSLSIEQLTSVVPVPIATARAAGVFALHTRENKTMWMQAPSDAESQTWIHKIQQSMGIA